MNLSSSPVSTLEVGGCSGRERLLSITGSVSPADFGSEVSPYVKLTALKAFSFFLFLSSSKKKNA